MPLRRPAHTCMNLLAETQLRLLLYTAVRVGPGVVAALHATIINKRGGQHSPPVEYKIYAQ